MPSANSKLLKLLDRLHERQRELVRIASEGDRLPPDGIVGKIADVENVIGAVELLIEQSEPRPSGAVKRIGE